MGAAAGGAGHAASAPGCRVCLGNDDAGHSHVGLVHPRLQPAQPGGVHAHSPAGAGDAGGPVFCLPLSGAAQHHRPPQGHARAVLAGLRGGGRVHPAAQPLSGPTGVGAVAGLGVSARFLFTLPGHATHHSPGQRQLPV